MFENIEIDYQRLPKYIIIAILIIGIVLLNFYFIKSYISSNSETINKYSLQDEDVNPVREAAVAGLFYPADSYQLEKDVSGYLQSVAPSLDRRPHILVVPHAGYMYSAEVAAKAYQQLLPFSKSIKKVIILGPSHRVAMNGIALSSAEYFATPLGKVKTDREITEYLKSKKGFVVNDRAHENEHALEVQLPFLQKVLKKYSIIPMVYGITDARELANELKPLLEKNDTLLVVSADLSHYNNTQTAKQIDDETINMVAMGEKLDEHQSCGATGINTAMYLAKDLSLNPVLMDQSNSGEISGITDSVVGYASWIFAGEPEPEKPLSPLEQETKSLQNFARHNHDDILQIAKRALSKAVAKKRYTPDREDYPNVMFDKGATFVTLTKKGELRGCIGSLLPKQAVALDIAQNTYSACNEDGRFNPITSEELLDIKISISFLSSYEKVEFDNEEELLNQIIPNVDGLVLRDGDRQGLFLPSVWKQIPDKKEFLNNLKIKAGLSPSYWSDKVKIYRFRTVEITEK
ncbi:MAG: AmmeMemoRadiSam system protein B [Alphaproteobacteria bacterium]|nr:AmmeMemoRadiSam system protein B [Alphaproteobacteria bacterium]